MNNKSKAIISRQAVQPQTDQIVQPKVREDNNKFDPNFLCNQFS